MLVLKELEMPDPVPMRPPGYFDECYTTKPPRRESNKTRGPLAPENRQVTGSGRFTFFRSRKKAASPRSSLSNDEGAA